MHDNRPALRGPLLAVVGILPAANLRPVRR